MEQRDQRDTIRYQVWCDARREHETAGLVGALVFARLIAIDNPGVTYHVHRLRNGEPRTMQTRQGFYRQVGTKLEAWVR